MSTARYLRKQLVAAGISGVSEIDSDSKRDRADVIQEFAPYYNDCSSAALAAARGEEIRSTPETPRVCQQPAESLREIRLKIEKHIKNSYLKQVQAPVGIKPQLKCWMEIN
jgi:hypothetical protein